MLSVEYWPRPFLNNSSPPVDREEARATGALQTSARAHRQEGEEWSECHRLAIDTEPLISGNEWGIGNSGNTSHTRPRWFVPGIYGGAHNQGLDHIPTVTNLLSAGLTLFLSPPV